MAASEISDQKLLGICTEAKSAQMHQAWRKGYIANVIHSRMYATALMFVLFNRFLKRYLLMGAVRAIPYS